VQERPFLCTAARPRCRNWRKPRACFICSTGLTRCGPIADRRGDNGYGQGTARRQPWIGTEARIEIDPDWCMRRLSAHLSSPDASVPAAKPCGAETHRREPSPHAPQMTFPRNC
jgi:hypothetical protein